jgi:hypothetical protein
MGFTLLFGLRSSFILQSQGLLAGLWHPRGSLGPSLDKAAHDAGRWAPNWLLICWPSFDVFAAFIVPWLAFMCDARASFILQCWRLIYKYVNCLELHKILQLRLKMSSLVAVNFILQKWWLKWRILYYSIGWRRRLGCERKELSI